MAGKRESICDLGMEMGSMRLFAGLCLDELVCIEVQKRQHQNQNQNQNSRRQKRYDISTTLKKITTSYPSIVVYPDLQSSIRRATAKTSLQCAFSQLATSDSLWPARRKEKPWFLPKAVADPQLSNPSPFSVVPMSHEIKESGHRLKSLTKAFRL